MEVVRQVYESSPDVITINVPEELRDRRVEVIVQPLADPAPATLLPELRENTVEELAAKYGLRPEEILDPGIMKFAGCMPDFLPLESQGELYQEPDIEALAAEWGVKPEEILDPGILRFAGCMPDFPPREPQETRAEFDCE
jgi:ribosome biogenesis SPOUT family RNA methylase Rps3